MPGGPAHALASRNRREQIEAIVRLERPVQAGDLVVDVDDELAPEELVAAGLRERAEGRILLGKDFEESAEGGAGWQA